jgi:hypothetical protein
MIYLLKDAKKALRRRKNLVRLINFLNNTINQTDIYLKAQPRREEENKTLRVEIEGAGEER